MTSLCSAHCSTIIPHNTQYSKLLVFRLRHTDKPENIDLLPALMWIYLASSSTTASLEPSISMLPKASMSIFPFSVVQKNDITEGS